MDFEDIKEEVVFWVEVCEWISVNVFIYLEEYLEKFVFVMVNIGFYD